ncbi:MAG: AsmA family protein [Devosia sp.]
MLNRLFIAIGVLVILAIGAAFVAPGFIQWGAYRERLETLTSEAFGAPVRINGDIQFSLLPQPQLVLSDVMVGDEAAPALKVARVEAQVSLFDFLRDQYRVTRLLLQSPQIGLTIGPDGNVTAGLVLAEGVGATNVSVAEALVADGRLRIDDQRTGTAIEVSGIEGEVRLDSLRGPFSFQGSSNYGGASYGVRLSSGKAGADGATPLSLFVKGGDDGFTLSAEGAFATSGPPKFTGTVSLRQPPPKPAAGQIADAGRGDFVLEGKLEASAERVLISDYTLSPDENRPGTRLSGAVELMLGKTPSFNAVVSGGVIVLPPRDATAELSDPPYELVRLLSEMPLPPIPPIPGSVGLDVAEINLRGVSLRQLQLDARTDTHTWQIERSGATLPGNGRISVEGNLSVVDGKPIFAGRLTAQTERLDALVQLWRKAPPGNPLFNIGGSLVSNLTLSSDTLALTGAELAVGDVKQKLDLEIGFVPTARHLKLSADLGSLSDEQSAMLAALVPEIGANGSFGATFPRGEVELSAARASIFGLAGQGLGLSANWDGGVLDVTRLAAEDLGGAKLDASFTAFGTLQKPELSGTGTVGLASPDAPMLAPLFAALGMAPVLQETIKRQLPADLALRLDPPTGEGGQSVGVSGTLGAATLSFDAKLGDGIVGLLDNSLSLSLEMSSDTPSRMSAQLGMGDGQIFPEDKPLRLIATLEGAPRTSLEARMTLEGGEDIVSFAGTIIAADPERVTGSGVVQATLGDPSALLEALGAGGIYGPAVSGTATLDFAGNEELRLGQIEGKSGGVPFTGLLSLTRRGDAANVVGSLDLTSFDAGALLPLLAGPAASLMASGEVWPQTPIDLGRAPRSVGGRVSVHAGEATAFGTPFLGDTNFSVDWDKQSLRIRNFEGVAGEGRIKFDAAICCSGALPDKQFTGRVTLSGVELDRLMPAPVKAVLGGVVDGSAQFDATGGNLATMMTAMTGSGSYTIKGFTAEHLDPDAFAAAGEFEDVFDMDEAVLEGLIRDRVGQGAFTAPDTTGTFTIAGGVLRSPNLAVDGPAARLFGGLSLRLSDLMLSGRYAMTPVAIVEAASGIAAATAEVAVDIAGSLWSPEASIDVSGLVSEMKIEASEAELARLEQLRVEEEARRRAAAEEQARLDVEQAAAEEAAKKLAAEEAARKAAAPEPPPLDLGL